MLLFEQDDVVLARAEAGRQLTSRQMVRLDEMVQRVEVGTASEEARALRLRSVMVALHQTAAVTRIDDVFANSEPTTLEGLALKAESLQNLHRDKEADVIYQELLSKLDEMYDDHSRRDSDGRQRGRAECREHCLPLGSVILRHEYPFGPVIVMPSTSKLKSAPVSSTIASPSVGLNTLMLTHSSDRRSMWWPIPDRPRSKMGGDRSRRPGCQ